MRISSVTHAPPVFVSFAPKTAAPAPIDTFTPAPLPAWYPAVDLAAVASKAAPAATAVNKLVFSDADLTLLDTTTPVLLRDKTTGALFKDPESGEVVRLGTGPKRDFAAELEALKAKYTAVDFSQYTTDFKEFNSIAEIMHTPVIKQDLKILKSGDKNFMITARSGDDVAPALEMYLAHQGVKTHGVFAVNNTTMLKQLGLDGFTLNGAQRKAVVMAALITAHNPSEVTFADDTDGNLIAAMQLLPKLFPSVKFRFVDMVHTGKGHRFAQELVAQGSGALSDRKGKPLTQIMIDQYKSNDAPF